MNDSFDALVDELVVDVRRRDGSISLYRFAPDVSLSALDVSALLSSLDAPSLHEARKQFVVAGTALVRRVRLLQAIGRRWPVLGAFARHSAAMRQCQLFLGGALAVTAAVAVLPPGWQTPGRSCDHGALCWAIRALGLLYVALAAALLLVEASLLALHALGGGAGGGEGGGAGRRLGLLLPALRQPVLLLIAVAALAAHPYLFALLAIDVVPSLPGCRALLRPLLQRLPALAALGALAAAALLAAAAVGTTLPVGSGCVGDGGAGYGKGQHSVAGCAAEAIVLGLPAAVAAPLLAASLPQPRPFLSVPEGEAGGEGGGGGAGEGGGGWLGAPLLLLLLSVAVLLLQACTRHHPPCTCYAHAVHRRSSLASLHMPQHTNCRLGWHWCSTALRRSGRRAARRSAAWSTAAWCAACRVARCAGTTRWASKSTWRVCTAPGRTCSYSAMHSNSSSRSSRRRAPPAEARRGVGREGAGGGVTRSICGWASACGAVRRTSSPTATSTGPRSAPPPTRRFTRPPLPAPLLAPPLPPPPRAARHVPPHTRRRLSRSTRIHDS